MKYNTLYKAVALGISIIAAASAHADDQAITGNGASFNLGEAKVTLGGFIAAEGYYRNRDQSADIGSSFTALPLANTDANHLTNNGLTARQSRLSLLIQGPEISGIKPEAYYEGDFLGSALTANSKQSNSYTPRARQLFMDFTTDYGLQVLAGQAWSLATQNKVGITARKENAPLTIDAQYVPGFTWTRNPQLRVVEKFNDMFSAGMSLENAQAIVGPAKAPAGSTVTTAIAGSANNNSTVNYTTDSIPDVIGKVAIDPGFGHFEALAMVRNFRDRVDPTAGGPAAGSNKTATAGGWGVNFIVPVVPKYLDFQGSVLNGKGIGRYGTSTLPDYTTKPDGSISAISETQALIGLVAHPTPILDLYAYAGMEKASRDDQGAGYGYGAQPAGVNIANCALSTSGSVAASTCNISTVKQVTVGGWYKFYQGNMGNMQAGLQYSHTSADAFSDAAGNEPKGSMNAAFFSLRYYPFQK
ncbi:MAG: hypothetical protein KGO49_03620 [Gammaproteobacteria bacterium]|nr:hypothetical protein [Gammaproteobacteria bacterium]